MDIDELLNQAVRVHHTGLLCAYLQLRAARCPAHDVERDRVERLNEEALHAESHPG